MNAAAWVALAGISATVVIQLIAFAFMFGRLFERVKALEARKDGSDCTAALAAMEAAFREFKGSLDHRLGSLEQTVQSIVMPKAPRRARAGE